MRVSVTDGVKLLQQGKTVVFPSETVYGLGACATNEQAVDLVYVIKKRPRDNPLICHFFSIEQIEEWVVCIPTVSRVILESFSPGPVSLLLDIPPHSKLLPATGGRATVICRIPNHPLALGLI
jgi:L-threonylcarbamoyladenylate synthase